MQKNKKVLIIAAVVLILIAAALFFIEGSKKPMPIEGAKTITVTVMQEGVENKVFTIHTDAEFLRGALEQEKLVEGTESQYPSEMLPCGSFVRLTNSSWYLLHRRQTGLSASDHCLAPSSRFPSDINGGRLPVTATRSLGICTRFPAPFCGSVCLHEI